MAEILYKGAWENFLHSRQCERPNQCNCLLGLCCSEIARGARVSHVPPKAVCTNLCDRRLSECENFVPEFHSHHHCVLHSDHSKCLSQSKGRFATGIKSSRLEHSEQLTQPNFSTIRLILLTICSKFTYIFIPLQSLLVFTQGD